MPSNRLLHLAVAVLVLALSRASFADEAKSYMGSSCKQIQSIDGQVVSSGNGGGIRNISDSSIDIVCPIVKSVPDMGQITEAYVYVDLGSVNARVKCDLNVFGSTVTDNSDPHLLGHTTASVTGTGIPAPLPLGPTSASLPAAWGTTSPSSSWSYYQLNCNLGPHTELKNYRIVEAGNRSETRKTYPPSMCHAVATSTTEWYETSGRLQTHPGNGTRGKFVCPIINDRMSNKNGITVDLSFGAAFGSNLEDFASCAVFSMDTFGTVSASSTFQIDATATGFPTINHRFSLGATPAAKNRYYLFCNMSGNGDSKLVSYRVEELGTTGDLTNADGKVYAGATCQGEPQNDPSLVTAVSDGSVKNASSTGYNSVFCPIITDHYGSTAGLSIARAFITRGSGSASFCSTYAYTPTGTFPSASSMGHTSNPPTATNEQVDMPIAGAPSNARYYMSCNLSGFSKLQQYEIQER